MKVGITYVVDLEDIPEELQKLIGDVNWELSDKLDELTRQIKSEDYVAAFNNIKEMRYNLHRVDTRLEDCTTILTGFLQVLKNLAEEAAAEAQRKKEMGLGVRQSKPAAVKPQDDSDD
jgi:hypothetical protein|tara:strand:- start:952 stop:1305 length:354 start_codon:yes stop_codon:yes gene_type:complete